MDQETSFSFKQRTGQLHLGMLRKSQRKNTFHLNPERQSIYTVHIVGGWGDVRNKWGCERTCEIGGFRSRAAGI